MFVGCDEARKTEDRPWRRRKRHEIREGSVTAAVRMRVREEQVKTLENTMRMSLYAVVLL
ncbi:hypothetical protein L195_g039734 [Trifolium pratense]|uniref:Uncharacterized protein n=1 Tax=Trifolium pratense TaxID=57577 RepID=A0A2K3LYT4_TRIPR|nr:hypothetical protein L195_g039734 [Trifolium pratense]